MDFVKKGMIASKYLADGCEFKKVKDNYKLISAQNSKYQPFIGKTLPESKWNLISKSTVTSGVEYDEFYSLLLDHFRSGNTIFNQNSNILLKKGEKVVFQSANNIVLKEPKSIRVTNSVRTGTSHRHGKNTFGYGASRSVGESKDIIKDIDVGQIIITNKRFIFSGNNRTIDVNISQITGITPYNNAFKLQRKSKQKPEYFINIDGFSFNYDFRGETYYVVMNGHIIKSLIEGGLNKTPQKSKLQLLASQPKITAEPDTVRATLDDFVFKFNDTWKRLEQIDDYKFTIEKRNGNYRAKIEISKTNATHDDEEIENEIKELFRKNDFEITEFDRTEINGIDMLMISSQTGSGNHVMEMTVTYFKNNDYRYSFTLINNKRDIAAKNDYNEMINTIRFAGDEDDDSDLKMKYCPNCGTPVEPDGKFCVNCGYKLN